MNKYKEFLNYMEEDLSGLPTLQASKLLEQTGAEQLYLVFVDIINGFCEKGALASDRVAKMVEPVRQLAQILMDQGIPNQNLIFLQDDHSPNAVEFGSFPPHCIRGTSEADTVKELRPFLEAPGADCSARTPPTVCLAGMRRAGVFLSFWKKCSGMVLPPLW